MVSAYRYVQEAYPPKVNVKVALVEHNVNGFNIKAPCIVNTREVKKGDEIMYKITGE